MGCCGGKHADSDDDEPLVGKGNGKEGVSGGAAAEDSPAEVPDGADGDATVTASENKPDLAAVLSPSAAGSPASPLPAHSPAALSPTSLRPEKDELGNRKLSTSNAGTPAQRNPRSGGSSFDNPPSFADIVKSPMAPPKSPMSPFSPQSQMEMSDASEAAQIIRRASALMTPGSRVRLRANSSAEGVVTQTDHTTAEVEFEGKKVAVKMAEIELITPGQPVIGVDAFVRIEPTGEEGVVVVLYDSNGDAVVRAHGDDVRVKHSELRVLCPPLPLHCLILHRETLQKGVVVQRITEQADALVMFPNKKVPRSIPVAQMHLLSPPLLPPLRVLNRETGVEGTVTASDFETATVRVVDAKGVEDFVDSCLSNLVALEAAQPLRPGCIASFEASPQDPFFDINAQRPNGVIVDIDGVSVTLELLDGDPPPRKTLKLTDILVLAPPEHDVGFGSPVVITATGETGVVVDLPPGGEAVVQVGDSHERRTVPLIKILATGPSSPKSVRIVVTDEQGNVVNQEEALKTMGRSYREVDSRPDDMVPLELFCDARMENSPPPAPAPSEAGMSSVDSKLGLLFASNVPLKKKRRQRTVASSDPPSPSSQDASSMHESPRGVDAFLNTLTLTASLSGFDTVRSDRDSSVSGLDSRRDSPLTPASALSPHVLTMDDPDREAPPPIEFAPGAAVRLVSSNERGTVVDTSGGIVRVALAGASGSVQEIEVPASDLQGDVDTDADAEASANADVDATTGDEQAAEGTRESADAGAATDAARTGSAMRAPEDHDSEGAFNLSMTMGPGLQAYLDELKANGGAKQTGDARRRSGVDVSRGTSFASHSGVLVTTASGIGSRRPSLEPSDMQATFENLALRAREEGGTEVGRVASDASSTRCVVGTREEGRGATGQMARAQRQKEAATAAGVGDVVLIRSKGVSGTVAGGDDGGLWVTVQPADGGGPEVYQVPLDDVDAAGAAPPAQPPSVARRVQVGAAAAVRSTGTTGVIVGLGRAAAWVSTGWSPAGAPDVFEVPYSDLQAVAPPDEVGGVSPQSPASTVRKLVPGGAVKIRSTGENVRVVGLGRAGLYVAVEGAGSVPLVKEVPFAECEIADGRVPGMFASVASRASVANPLSTPFDDIPAGDAGPAIGWGRGTPRRNGPRITQQNVVRRGDGLRRGTKVAATVLGQRVEGVVTRMEGGFVTIMAAGGRRHTVRTACVQPLHAGGRVVAGDAATPLPAAQDDPGSLAVLELRDATPGRRVVLCPQPADVDAPDTAAGLRGEEGVVLRTDGGRVAVGVVGTEGELVTHVLPVGALRVVGCVERAGGLYTPPGASAFLTAEDSARVLPDSPACFVCGGCGHVPYQPGICIPQETPLSWEVPRQI